MSRLAAALQINSENGLSEPVTSAQMDLSRRKLARLRANLKAIRNELSNKLLYQMEDCRNTVNTTMDALGEIHVAFNPKNK